MNNFLADCLLASMERAGHAISQTPSNPIVDKEWNQYSIEIKRIIIDEKNE